MLKIFCFLLNFFLIFLLISSIKNKEINEKSSKLSVSNIYEKQAFLIECEIKKGIFQKKVDGKIFFKDNKFRLFLYKDLEKKIDVGCDDTYFWYWSYNEQKDTLFYSDYCYMDSVLKDCYQPSWMVRVFKNLNKVGDKYNLIKSNKVVCVATISKQEILYDFKENGLFITIKIKDAFKNFDESVFKIPNEFKIYNKMTPIFVLPTIF